MKKLLVLMIVLSLLCSGALSEENRAPGITLFRLCRTADTPTRLYSVFWLDGAYRLCVRDGVSEKIDAETVQKLEDILTEYGVPSWDGFCETNSDVLDGEFFSLNVVYSDGTSVSCSGSNAFPAGYFDAAGEIESLLSAEVAYPARGPAGRYVYEGGGFFDDFVLTLMDDGTYTFYEGALSSYMGGGRWSASEEKIYLSETNGYDLYQTFISAGDCLYFLSEESDNFPYVKVPDLGRFWRAEDEEE